MFSGYFSNNSNDRQRDGHSSRSFSHGRDQSHFPESEVRTNVLSDAHVYYNANLHNNSDDSILAKFEESRVTSILTDPHKYKMAIVRFDVPNSTPKLSFIEDFYYVTLTWTGTGTVDNPQYTSGNVALLLTQTQQGSSPNANPNSQFYYGSFIESYNEALDTALGLLITNYEAVEGGGTWPGPTEPPKIVYVPESRLFKLYATFDWQDNGDTQMWINYDLHRLFQGFVVDFYGTNRPNRRDIRYWIKNYVNNNVQLYSITAGSLVEYLEMSTEISSVSRWYELYKIVLISNTLDIRKEFISPQTPLPVDIAGASIGGSGENVQRSVVTDFNYDVEGDDSTVYGRINFIPTGEPRFIDLQTTTPLQKVDLQFFWESRNGKLNPLYIGPGDNMNVKLLFAKIT